MSETFRMSRPTQSLSSPSARIRAVLEKAKRQVGYIPNMYARMANSPGLLDASLYGYDLFRRKSGFTPVEQEVVFLTIARENGCHYCVAAHSALADTVPGVPAHRIWSPVAAKAGHSLKPAGRVETQAWAS